MGALFSGKPPERTTETRIAFNLQKCELEDQYGQYVALWLFGDERSLVKKINLYQVFSYGNRYGECDPRNIIKLGRELSHANVTISLQRIPPYKEDIIPSRGFSGNTEDHKVLCARSALWLQERGIKWVGSQNYAGGRSDVTAIEERIVVECGYTNAYKALESLSDGWFFMVVPYATESSAALDVNYNDELIGFSALDVKNDELIGFYFAPAKELIYKRELQASGREAEKQMDKLFEEYSKS